MCNHEESTSPTRRHKTAWGLIDDANGPMHRLYNLDSMLQCARMAIEHLNEESSNDDLCHLSHLLMLADKELTEACGDLEGILRKVNVHA